MIQLSIIITIYNLDSWLLERCLQSIREQQMNTATYEIIVIDDGSVQPPVTLATQHPDLPLRIEAIKHAGIGGARNHAMGIAQGHYLFMMDGDDYLFPETLNGELNLLTREQPDILIHGVQPVFLKERIQATCVSERIRSYTSGVAYMQQQNLSGGNWLYLFRRELVLTHALHYSEGIVHEDEEFIPKLFCYAGKVVTTTLPVYAYYQRPTSIVHHPSPEQETIRFRDFLYVILQLQQFQKCQLAQLPEAYQALQRKIDFLQVDFLRKIFRSAQPEVNLEHYLPILRKKGLYPLPKANYSFSYRIFRFLSNQKIGLLLLQKLDALHPRKF